MATVTEALNACIDRDTKSGYQCKSARAMKAERNLLIRQLLKFLENLDEGLSVMEVRQALEEFDTSAEVQ